MKRKNNSKASDEPLKKKVVLSYEDCYCGICDFYRNVAVMSGAVVDDETTEYKCTEICVTPAVKEAIFAYYREQMDASNESLGMAWVCYGPKASLEGEKDVFVAEITDKFLYNATNKVAGT